MRGFVIGGLVLVALAAGLTWWHQGREPMACPDGAAPSALDATVVIGTAHGAMEAALVLDGDRLTARSALGGSGAGRVVTTDERRRLLQGLRAPPPLPPSVGHAMSVVAMTVTCSGAQRTFTTRAEVGVQHATLQTVVSAPGWGTLTSWLSGTLRELDPHPRRVTAFAFEVLRVADLEADLIEPAPPAFDPDAPPVRSSLRLGLVGTLMATEPELSIASIQDCVTLATQTFSVGDVVQGAEVLSIERQRVIVRHDERRESVAECPVTSPGPAPAATRAARR